MKKLSLLLVLVFSSVAQAQLPELFQQVQQAEAAASAAVTVMNGEAAGADNASNSADVERTGATIESVTCSDPSFKALGDQYMGYGDTARTQGGEFYIIAGALAIEGDNAYQAGVSFLALGFWNSALGAFQSATGHYQNAAGHYSSSASHYNSAAQAYSQAESYYIAGQGSE